MRIFSRRHLSLLLATDPPAAIPRFTSLSDVASPPSGHVVWSSSRTADLFPSSAAPTPEDVEQDPRWEDCHLLAPAQAVVARYPFYPHWMMRISGNSVTVRHFNRDRELCLTTLQTSLFRRKWHSSRAGAGRRYLWPAYMEKAWAASHGGGEALVQRNDPSSALVWLLGCEAYYTPINGHHPPLAAATRIARLLAQGECIVLHRRDGHCLSVLDCDVGSAGEAVLRLMDPRRRRGGTRHSKWNVEAQDGEFAGYASTVDAWQSILRSVQLDRTRSSVVVGSLEKPGHTGTGVCHQAERCTELDMNSINHISRPTFFAPSSATPSVEQPIDIEMGKAPGVAPSHFAPQAPQLVPPGSGPMLGAGKSKEVASVGTAVVLGVAGLLAIATGLAVGLGPDNNSGRWIGGWVGAWCGVGAALLAGSAVACCVAQRRA